MASASVNTKMAAAAEASHADVSGQQAAEQWMMLDKLVFGTKQRSTPWPKKRVARNRSKVSYVNKLVESREKCIVEFDVSNKRNFDGWEKSTLCCTRQPLGIYPTAGNTTLC